MFRRILNGTVLSVPKYFERRSSIYSDAYSIEQFCWFRRKINDAVLPSVCTKERLLKLFPPYLIIDQNSSREAKLYGYSYFCSFPSETHSIKRYHVISISMQFSSFMKKMCVIQENFCIFHSRVRIL